MRDSHHPPLRWLLIRLVTLFYSLFLISVIHAQKKKDSASNCSNLFAGFSSIFEDSKPRFNTYGLNAVYIRPIMPRLGLTGDAGIYFGSGGEVDYTKLQLMGGISLFPANSGNIAISPHVLAGVSNVTSKFKSPTSTFKNNSSAFTMALGGDAVIPLNNKINLGLRADVNPTFGTQIKWNLRLGGGVYIKFGCKKPEENTAHTTAREECQASLVSRELKISLIAIEATSKSIEKIANNIPRVEAKINVKPQLTVKQGEECCSKDKPPVSYTELKGGVEGSFEVNINLWGIPDINYSIKIWPVLIIAEFQCKLFAGPTGKINFDGVGKFYGELGSPDPSQQCRACAYLNLKAEGFLRVGVKAGGKINIFHWGPRKGFDVTGEPDEQVEASAEASAGIGNSFNGTYVIAGECPKPPPGLHGTFSIGRAKANLKFNLKLGPLSFDPSFEVNLFDGFNIVL